MQPSLIGLKPPTILFSLVGIRDEWKETSLVAAVLPTILVYER